ncbi:hypothetical protein LEMLEM_LOCUS14815, partial [Lemmus lemmus]
MLVALHVCGDDSADKVLAVHLENGRWMPGVHMRPDGLVCFQNPGEIAGGVLSWNASPGLALKSERPS